MTNTVPYVAPVTIDGRIPGITLAQCSYADVDLAGAGPSRGYFTVPVRVTGYWSSDPITIYVRRTVDYDRRQAGEEPEECVTWRIEVTHSSGGRDANVEPDDVVAESNFAVGLWNACLLGSMIRLQHATMEAAYQAQEAAYREHEAAEKRAKEAAVEADQPLGLSGAGLVMTAAAGLAKPGYDTAIDAFPRGCDQPLGLLVRRSRGDRVTYYHPVLGRISALKFQQMLGSCSHRSGIRANQ